MFVIQDPTDANSTPLLESILSALKNATGVKGAFAFASAQGVRLLSQSAEFKSLASSSPIDLIVGIDAITNEHAIASFKELTQMYPMVQVRAFMNPRPGTYFHPKFCWTTSQDGGHLIVGSGNLTENGLLGNWEAYSAKELSSSELSSVVSTWNAWVTLNETLLLPLDDPRVIEQVKSNTHLAMEGDWPKMKPAFIGKDADPEPATTQLIASDASVLVAEVPRSSNRKSQVNFHKEDYYSFFGAKQGRLVVFRQVNEDGTMPDYEQSRPPVVAKSVNFRFELDGMKTREYPDIGRPIGVYIRVATRTFFYRILLPLMAGYNELDSVLSSLQGDASAKMRTTRLNAEELRQVWPTAPFWKLPTDIKIDTE